MPCNATNPDPAPDPAGQAALLREAVQRNRGPLLRTVTLLVARTCPRLSWAEVTEQAGDVLDEAVEQALTHAARYDPERAALAWIRGIAARVWLNRQRGLARERRCVPGTSLGDQAWEAALARLGCPSADEAVGDRLDVQQALARLAPAERQVLELRYFQGLEGDELARALGAPTSGAARVRLCRALQALRAQFRGTEAEVMP